MKKTAQVAPEEMRSGAAVPRLPFRLEHADHDPLGPRGHELLEPVEVLKGLAEQGREALVGIRRPNRLCSRNMTRG